jgi:RNA polymerase sigma-70 factor (ECF subfamily)
VDHYRRLVRASSNERELEAMATLASRDGDGADALEALLAPLSESEREVVAMLKVEGMSLEEVARATSATVGSVKQKAHRAYKKLREAMSATAFRKGQSGGLS